MSQQQQNAPTINLSFVGPASGNTAKRKTMRLSLNLDAKITAEDHAPADCPMIMGETLTSSVVQSKIVKGPTGSAYAPTGSIAYAPTGSSTRAPTGSAKYLPSSSTQGSIPPSRSGTVQATAMCPVTPAILMGPGSVIATTHPSGTGVGKGRGTGSGSYPQQPPLSWRDLNKTIKVPGQVVLASDVLAGVPPTTEAYNAYMASQAQASQSQAALLRSVMVVSSGSGLAGYQSPRVVSSGTGLTGYKSPVVVSSGTGSVQQHAMAMPPMQVPPMYCPEPAPPVQVQNFGGQPPIIMLPAEAPVARKKGDLFRALLAQAKAKAPAGADNDDDDEPMIINDEAGPAA